MPERRPTSTARLIARLFLLAAVAAGGTVLWLWMALAAPYQGFAKEGVFVDIPRGASRRMVARLLKRNGVIRSAIAFEIYARRHPKRTIIAGEYFFDRPETGRDVFWKLANGQVFEQPFVVREGETMFDIARELEAGKLMRASEFLYEASDPALIRDLAPQATTLEGFLFPATYEFPRHPTAREVTSAMAQKFKAEWASIAAHEIRERGIVQVVTLASLVERETPQPDERPLVASVFENRLRLGRALQCDPTVIYALQRLGKYNGSLSSADLHFDSAYNTYRYPGLPPGPIGNPGEASLRAAFAPAKTDYLYFVANTQGGHFFSKSLVEHNRNVARYRRLLSGQPADPEPAPAPTAPPKKHARHKRAARRVAR